jgi:sec-independent protein translocase protein TatC
MKLLVSLLTVLVCAIALCFLFARELYAFAILPLSWVGIETRPWSPIRPFPSAMRIAFNCAVTFALPVLLCLLGDHLLRARPRAEMRSIRPALLVGWPVYLAGAWFAYRHLAPMILNYIRDYERKSGYFFLFDLQDYFCAVSLLCILTGLLCALPVIAIILSRKDVVTYRGLSRTRFYALTAILVLVAFAAPAPTISTLALVVAPFWIVYELCIWIVWLLERLRARVDYAQDNNGTA